ncbi:patatin-like phospholipase family protein [Ideonella sp.]|jgi:NTE family protein|uniref:patatin-like phospholipase family protein n=1 Tax=Ideonella sp. TaxID=1929293 RepID=UPI0037C15F95
MTHVPQTGLILTGGGARAAYQVGVLKALRDIRQSCVAPAGNPFPVIAGTSAGAINAAALAGCADEFDLAVSKLVEVWAQFHADQVYRADSIGVIRSGANWLTMMSIGWVIARWRKLKPRSLLDNSPLASLLSQLVAVERVPQLIAQGHLKALAVSASSYSSGQHVTFYDAAQPADHWVRSQRMAVHSRISVEHLLASAAIPFVFPATRLPLLGEQEWFGDGSMRQAAPISPAVHLGAERVLVVGAGRMHEPPGRRVGSTDYPNMAQIAGHALSNIFLDALAVDVERLQRINATLRLLPPEARAHTHLRPIDVLVIAPTQRLDDIAARHLNALPTPIRALLRGVGVNGQGQTARGAALASYLLFESDYTCELMALGEADTLARRQEVLSFFGWSEPLAASGQKRPQSGVAVTASATV